VAREPTPLPIDRAPVRLDSESRTDATFHCHRGRWSEFCFVPACRIHHAVLSRCQPAARPDPL